jgi:hypothetical protein
MNRQGNSFNNNLVNKFQSYMNNNMPFVNNPLLASNPNFTAALKDSSFYNKINMAKLEQISRAKNIEDIGMDKKQLSELIICPITINKTTADELKNELVIKEPEYSTQNNKYLEEIWKSRTNQPYKNVIKKDLFTKDFKKYYKNEIFNTDVKKKDELIVHNITDLDSDSILLEAEFELLSDILEKHNKELKVIYSASKEALYKKEFEYVQNYRYRLEYNPKNSEELKDFYKKEQKKINKEKKMIDEMIDILVENDDLTKDEIDKLNTTLTQKNSSNQIESLEDELRKELGDDFDEIMESIEVSGKDTKKSNRIKISTETVSDEPKKTLKKRITVKTISENTENTNNYTNVIDASVSEDIKNKYKNRK